MTSRKQKNARNHGGELLPGKSLRILIADGVNMDLLGQREPEIYGTSTLEEIHRRVADEFGEYSAAIGLPECELHFFQTNHEGFFLDTLSGNWDGLILNPGAWSHTSMAIADRIRALSVPCIEVHLSNIHARGPAREKSLTAAAATGVLCGFGSDGYLAALILLLRQIRP